jgi:hypothetical protein
MAQAMMAMAVVFLWAASARAVSVNYNAQVQAEATKYHTPEDVMDMVPGLNQLPRTLRFGEGYTVKFSSDRLKIHHETRETRTGKTESCRIGLSYSAPVGGSLSSEINLPLFHAPTLGTSDWSRSSFGDYDVSMTRTALDHSAFKVALTARF